MTEGIATSILRALEMRGHHPQPRPEAGGPALRRSRPTEPLAGPGSLGRLGGRGP
jgi:hypothetical protein